MPIRNGKAYTEDGHELPPLRHSNKPEHILGQRQMDEDLNITVEALLHVANWLKMYRFCGRADCARRRRCMSCRRETKGRFAGLYPLRPECILKFQPELRPFFVQLRADMEEMEAEKAGK